MESAAQTTTLVIMGVSGSGKTTVAEAACKELGWEFAEGDAFHPAANVEKMRAGHPLDDADRRPWLLALAAWIGEHEAAGRDVVLTCSALKRSYRDLLSEGHPSVLFVHVTVDADVLRERLLRRTNHYMPASLLDSQLATLEPLQPDEHGFTLPGDEEPAAVVADLVRHVRSLAGDAA